MRRSCILEAAIAALLFANTGTTAAALFPPTRIQLVDVQGRPVAGAVVGIDVQYDRDREPSFTSREGIEARTDDRGEALLTIKYETGIYAIREDRDHPLVGVTMVTREAARQARADRDVAALQGPPAGRMPGLPGAGAEVPCRPGGTELGAAGRGSTG